MVLPEGTPTPDRDRPRAPAVAAVGIALLALLAATFALGQATSQSEDLLAGSTSTTEIAPFVQPTTTTTIDINSFSASNIATGDRFFWMHAPPASRLWPIDLIEHDGLVYLFGSKEAADRPGAGKGASAWISSNGIRWEALGEVVPESHTVRRVVSTEWGLIALGAGSDRTPVVWTSGDGRAFQASPLPIDEATAGTSFELNDAIVSDGRLLVIGIQVPDRTSEVVVALPETLVGPNRDSLDLDFELGRAEDDSLVHLYAPLGLHAVSLQIRQLGLDKRLESVLVGPEPPTRQFIWSSEDGLDWEIAEVRSPTVQELWRLPSGDLLAYGHSGRGSTILISADEMTWEPRVSSHRDWWAFEVGALTIWENSLVGGGRGEDLLVTSDGLSWERLGTGALLPDSIDWRLGPGGAGDAGLVIVAEALRANRPPLGFTPVVIEAGEATLTLDLGKARLVVDRLGYDQLEIPLWERDDDGLYEVDLLQETVTFTNPGGGEPLATVGFATLDKAESSALLTGVSNERALLFTPDGEAWSVQSLSNVVAETHEVQSIVTLEDRVLLLTYDTGELGTYTPPQVSIVIGQIDR